MRSVLADGFEKPRKECRAHDLELQRLRVSELNYSLAVVFTVQERKVLLM